MTDSLYNYTPPALTPTEVFEAIAAELARLEQSGKPFQPFINHGENGDFLIARPTEGPVPMWIAETCFQHFVTGPSFFVECRVHWTRTMAYWKAQPSESVERAVFFNQHGRADGPAASVTHLTSMHHQFMEVRSSGNYLLRAYTMTGMTLEQWQELCSMHNAIRYPHSHAAYRRRCERAEASRES